MTISLHVKVVFLYPKEIVLVPNNRNLFLVNRHLATATENNLLLSLPRTTASQYSLSRAVSDHLAIRSSCVPGCNVVAEGGQSWCGTRNLKTFNKKNENSRCTSSALQERKEEKYRKREQQEKAKKGGEGVAVGDSEPNKTRFTDKMNAGSRRVGSQSAVLHCSGCFSTNVESTTAMRMQTPKSQVQSTNAPPAATICE